MPKKIPLVQRQIGGIADNSTLQPFVQPNLGTARVLKGAGAAVSGIGDIAGAIAAGQEIDERTDLLVQFDEFEKNELIRFNNASKNAIPNAPGGELRQIGGESWDEEFKKEQEANLTKLSQDIKFSGNSAIFRQKASQLRSAFAVKLAAGRLAIAGQKAVLKHEKEAKALEVSAFNDPRNTTKYIQNYKDYLTASGLDEQNKLKLEQKRVGAIANSGVLGLIQQNPDEAKKQLEAGVWDEFLGTDRQSAGKHKKSLLREVERKKEADRVQQEKQIKQAEEVEKQQAKNAMDEYFTKIGDGSVNAQDVYKDNRLPPTGANSKQQALSLIRQNLTNPKTDNRVFRQTFERIHLPDDDPRKIIDDSDLIQQHINGGLSYEDLGRLRKELSGRTTPEGLLISNQKKRLIESAKSRLTKPSFANPIGDPNGLENLAQFEKFVEEEINRTKKEGKSVLELFNSSNSKSLFRSIGAFEKSPQQILKESSEKLKSLNQKRTTAPSVEPLKEGESLEAYEKRALIGK